jgi:hypothetical protein
MAKRYKMWAAYAGPVVAFEAGKQGTVDVGSREWVDASDYDALAARLVEAEAGLREIAAFGLRNSGCGYSCARKAEAVLKRLTDSASGGRDG